MGDKMVLALDNLANAAVQKSNTFEQLVTANKTLIESICLQQDDSKKLLAIITALSTSDREGGRTPSGGGKVPTAPGANGGGGAIPWDPVGYCWSHGFKIKMGHSSATCENKKEGHDSHLNAKRGDKQGGCKWNEKWKAK